MTLSLKYTGQVLPQPGERDRNGASLFPYLPNTELVDAVNQALYLGRPLLVRSDPGNGKTTLAAAIAYELELPYVAWYVKSTSRVRDGLYIYDKEKRLHDIQLVSMAQSKGSFASDPNNYIYWGPLGYSYKSDKPTVLLLDEIDKTNDDFPHDLFLELDQPRFVIEETGQEISALHTPIVIITSNDNKNLPDVMFRRCITHYIKFPTQERLEAILDAHFPSNTSAFNKAVVENFLALRHEIFEINPNYGRELGVRVLLDLFRLLQVYPEDEAFKKLSPEKIVPLLGFPETFADLIFSKKHDLELEKPRSISSLSMREIPRDIKVFYSYSHKDEKLRNKLETHLSLLKHQGHITSWNDRKINPGDEWAVEINKHLNTADIILLLISPDFMASNYCYSKEMLLAMERHERGEAKVIPIILRKVSWQDAPFGKLQALPTDAKPIASPSWHNQDEAFFNVAEGIKKAVAELTKPF